MTDTPLEEVVEQKFVEYAEWECGCRALKMEVAGSRNWPDRQILCGNGYVFYIEFKRLGKEPRRGQLSRHKKLRARGYNVYVCDNLEDAKRILDGELMLL